jgi:hypothetical protein
LANANLDDIRNPESLAQQAAALDEDPNAMLVFSSFYLTWHGHDTWHKNHIQFIVDQDGSILADQDGYAPAASMAKCLAGPQPMWRKSVHNVCGYFDVTFYIPVIGNFEQNGVMALNLKIPGVSGIYYENPEGLSTNQDPIKVSVAIKKMIALL